MNKKRAYQIIAVSWLYTAAAVCILLVLLFVCFALLRGAMIVLGGLGILSLTFSICVFVFSEPLIVRLMKCQRIENDPKYAEYVEDIYTLCRGRWLINKPRLYVANGMDVPNAFAFGWGFAGQYAIAITPKIKELLDRQQLKAVAAHELAHIIHLDVGLMTCLSIVKFFIDKLKKTVFGFFGRVAWLAWIGAFLIEKFVKLMIMFVSQEREIAADAKGSLLMGSPQPLREALAKLSSASKKIKKNEPKTLVDDLFVSHPGMEERDRSLASLNY